MHKIFISLFFMLHVSSAIEAKEKIENQTVKKELAERWNVKIRNYYNSPVEARIQILSGKEELDDNSITIGLIEILSPDKLPDVFLCFPRSSAELKQVYLIAQMTCRKSGYMTVTEVDWIPRNVSGEVEHYGLNPSSLNCSGRGSNVPHCNWNGNGIEDCQLLTKISCSACQKTVKGLNGAIESPGFPLIIINDITCEWIIEVPEETYILLKFEYFEKTMDEFVQIPCEIHLPYVEIMYGFQSSVTVDRFCQASELENVTVPFNTAKIRVFTGFQAANGNDKGVKVTFQSIPKSEDDEDDLESPLRMVLLATLGFIFIACTVVCHYIRKHKFCDFYLDNYKILRSKHVEPTFEFQIAHLRSKDSNGNIVYEEKSEKGLIVNIEEPMSDSKTATVVHFSSPSDTPKGIYSVMTLDEDGNEIKRSSSLRDKKPAWECSVVEDPNRLSVTSPVCHPPVSGRYPMGRHISSESHIGQDRSRLHHCLSTL